MTIKVDTLRNFPFHRLFLSKLFTLKKDIKLSRLEVDAQGYRFKKEWLNNTPKNCAMKDPMCGFYQSELRVQCSKFMGPEEWLVHSFFFLPSS